MAYTLLILIGIMNLFSWKLHKLHYHWECMRLFDNLYFIRHFYQHSILSEFLIHAFVRLKMVIPFSFDFYSSLFDGIDNFLLFGNGELFWGFVAGILLCRNILFLCSLT